MGNTINGQTDNTWVWVIAIGVIAFIIGLILLLAVENRAIGAIILFIGFLILLVGGYLWWASQHKQQPNNF